MADDGKKGRTLTYAVIFILVGVDDGLLLLGQSLSGPDSSSLIRGLGLGWPTEECADRTQLTDKITRSHGEDSHVKAEELH